MEAGSDGISCLPFRNDIPGNSCHTGTTFGEFHPFYIPPKVPDLPFFIICHTVHFTGKGLFAGANAREGVSRTADGEVTVGWW